MSRQWSLEDPFRGNPNLKRIGVNIEYTDEQVAEILKCAEDPHYFCENYIKIVNLDEGLVNFTLRDYQQQMISNLHSNRFNIFATCRQSGKTTSVAAYIVWYMLFEEYFAENKKPRTIAILANKEKTAVEILSRVQLAYQHLPKWMQQGVEEWSKKSFKLENGAEVFASATSSDAIRGYSINMLFIDEAAHIENWDEFFSAVFPTVSSGHTTKVTLVSTPNGLNHFYNLWNTAEKGKNQYKTLKVMWYDVPGRDEKWKEDTLADMGNNVEKFEQEHCVEFLGSSGTLIAGWKLRELVYQDPIHFAEHLRVYKQAEKGALYSIVADVSRGKALDYSACSVIRIDKMPYEQVATFRSNQITPHDYSKIVFSLAHQYNQAAVLVEINDIGQQVADNLYYDFEYENVMMTESAGRAGKRISTGFGGSKDKDIGIRTTKTVKATGCQLLKLLVEGNKLIINDFNTIDELNRFSAKGGSYEAEPGAHDDLVMGLVLFGWLTTDKFFKELTDINTLEQMREKSEEHIESMLMPMMIVADGHDHHSPIAEHFDEKTMSFEQFLLS